jgi:cobalt-zinc-cadmium resistance protein CzcA
MICWRINPAQEEQSVPRGIVAFAGSGPVTRVGRDVATHAPLADMREARQARGVAGLLILGVVGRPTLNISVDRDAAARYGLNTGKRNTPVQTALGGQVASTLLEADRQFIAAVCVATRSRDSIDAVRAIKVGHQAAAGGNAGIALNAFATITLATGASVVRLRQSAACSHIHRHWQRGASAFSSRRRRRNS